VVVFLVVTVAVWACVVRSSGAVVVTGGVVVVTGDSLVDGTAVVDGGTT
jgi:formylmethanofuran dehydrogenase subunit C